MTDTTCPSCERPLPPGRLLCALRLRVRGGRGHGPAPAARAGRPLGLAAAALALASAVVVALLLIGGDGGEPAARGAPSAAHLEAVLSDHPLTKRAAERILEERYFPVPDDDESDVHCSGRVPKPAHSVRRCYVTYPGGIQRRVAVLTTANGSEVLSNP